MNYLSIVLIALVVSFSARAASPEESYLAARDRHIAKFKKLEEAGEADERVAKQEAAARAELELLLEKIVGPVAVEGFTEPGRLSLESLFGQDVGADQLDGLAFSSDDKAQLLVTTDGLFKHWLRAHQKAWTKAEAPPQTLEQALKSEFFYTLAVSPDAAVAKYADIPVSKPAKAELAVALLDQRSQDVAGASIPDEIIVAVVRDGRLFVATTQSKAKIVAHPTCDKLWSGYEAKANKALADYSASGRTDEAAFSRYTRLQDEGSAAFRRCFAERAKSEAFFAEATREAQTLAERLAGK